MYSENAEKYRPEKDRFVVVEKCCSEKDIFAVIERSCPEKDSLSHIVAADEDGWMDLETFWRRYVWSELRAGAEAGIS